MGYHPSFHSTNNAPPNASLEASVCTSEFNSVSARSTRAKHGAVITRFFISLNAAYAVSSQFQGITFFIS